MWSARSTRSSCQSAQASICETHVFLEEQEPIPFSPNDKKYLCFCGHAHSVTGVRLIICMLLFTLCIELYELSVAIYFYFVSNTWDELQSSTTTNLALGTTVTVCLMIALRFGKAAFLVPYLFMQAIGLISCVVFCIGWIYVGLFKDKKVALGLGMTEKETEHLGLHAWLQAGSYLFLSGLQVWLISIVISCWRYLRDVSSHASIENDDSLAPQPIHRGLRRSMSEDGVYEPRRAKVEARSISVSLAKHPDIASLGKLPAKWDL